MKKLICCLFLFSLYSPLGFSWGKTGHRIVGEIAQRNISAKTKKALVALLGTEDLWKSSTWPDEIRSDPKMRHTTPWHYVSIPTGKSYFDQKRNKDGDVIEALYRFEDILRDPKTPKDQKIEAVRFIVHFIGDLHQPLHVGLEEDRGGNTIRVKWFRNETNLHAVWDEEIIDDEKLSYTEYSTYLNKFTPDELKDWKKGTYLDWSVESMELRPKVYDIPENKSLGYEYAYKVKPIIEMRLKQAGIRLAFVLDRIFSNDKLDKKELEIRAKIKENI